MTLTYLLILFVIALALAPLTHFIPSKRQRRIAGLREYAAVHGLFVEFRDLPKGGAPSLARPSRGHVIYYGKRIAARRVRPVEAGAWIYDQDSWRSVGRRLPVPQPVQGLPADILAASVDAGSCGVYWTESSGEAGVEHIRQVLECWCEELIS